MFCCICFIFPSYPKFTKESRLIAACLKKVPVAWTVKFCLQLSLQKSSSQHLGHLLTCTVSRRPIRDNLASSCSSAWTIAWHCCKKQYVSWQTAFKAIAPRLQTNWPATILLVYKSIRLYHLKCICISVFAVLTCSLLLKLYWRIVFYCSLILFKLALQPLCKSPWPMLLLLIVLLLSLFFHKCINYVNLQ